MPTSTDLMLAEIKSQIEDYSVGFVRPGGTLGGTGVLVEAHGKKAILTADHVVDPEVLNVEKEFGLIALSSLKETSHRMTIGKAARQTIARGNDESRGPDLALVHLSIPDVGKLTARGKSFYDLTMREKLGSQLAFPAGSSAFVVGLIGQRTKDEGPAKGFKKSIGFKGIMDSLLVTAYESRGEYDFLSGKVNYHGAELTSYGGCSGGGVWQIDQNSSDGKKKERCSAGFFTTSGYLINKASAVSNVTGQRASINQPRCYWPVNSNVVWNNLQHSPTSG